MTMLKHQPNGSVRATTERQGFGYLPRKKSQISQKLKPTLINANDVCNTDSTFYTTHQPSVSRSYDWCSDSSSVDLIADMISDDELSIDLEKTVVSKPSLQCHSRNDSLECVNNAQSPIAIAQKSLKKNQHASYKSVSAVSTSTSAGAIPISKRYHRSQSLRDKKNKLRSLEVKHRHRKIKSIKKPVTPYIDIHVKNKLRSLEVKHRHRKIESIKKPVTPYIDIHVVTDLNKCVSCDEPLLDQRTHSRKMLLVKQRIMEITGEIICICLTLGFFYFIFMLYKDSVSAIMQGSNIPFSTLR